MWTRLESLSDERVPRAVHAQHILHSLSTCMIHTWMQNITNLELTIYGNVTFIMQSHLLTPLLLCYAAFG